RDRPCTRGKLNAGLPQSLCAGQPRLWPVFAAADVAIMIGYRQSFQTLNALALGRPHGARGAHAGSTRHDLSKALTNVGKSRTGHIGLHKSCSSRLPAM